MAYIGRDLQYGVLDKQTLTGANSVKTVWNDLSYGVASASNLLVSVGGLIQEPEVAYTASGTTLTFVDAPTAADTVYIIFLGKELTVPNTYSDLSYQTGTGDGTDTTPIAVLDKTAPTNGSIMVMLDGVTQVPGTDYSVSGTTLTFTTAPANGVDILVYFLGVVRNIGTPSDGTVTSAKLAADSVTSAKIVDGAIVNADINASAAIALSKLASDPTTKVYSGSLTRDNTAATASVAYTGIGFQPKSVIFFSNISGTDTFSVGFDEGVTGNSIYANTTNYGLAAGLSIFPFISSGTYQTGVLSALGADGFTISWIKTGSPTGTTTVYYLAIG